MKDFPAPKAAFQQRDTCDCSEATQQPLDRSVSQRSTSDSSDSSETLILIANDQEATICRSRDGTTTIVGKIVYDCGTDANPSGATDELIGENRWSRRVFARKLIAMLESDVARNCPDCFVILANETIRENIRKVAAHRLSYSLIMTLLDAASEPQRSEADE